MRLTDYNTSLSGMLAAQLGLQTTKQNLSNIHTPGYVRQVVNYRSVGGRNGNTPEQQIGYGVQTVSVDRVTDAVKTRQYNEQLSQLSYYSYRNSTLSQVESMVGSTGENSLSSLMDQFFNGFREVAKNPEQPNYYHTLIAQTNKFTNQLNRLAQNFEQAELQTGTDVTQHVNEFNRLARNLAEANRKIGQAGEHVPNQLLDERDQIITEMSQYANIDVSYESMNPNIASVRINGVLAVSGQNITGEGGSQDSYPLQLISNNGALSVQISGTEIPLQGAIQAAIDTKKTIAGYKGQLNDLMVSLKDKVNGITQQDFFVGDSAKNMKLNPDFEQDVTKMKMSVDTANQLAGLGDQMYAGGLTYKQSLDKQIVQVATDTNASGAYQTIHEDLLNGIQQEKASLEGVNMDEEMVNLMTYQKYFVANSKAITTINEVFDSLFAIIR
ncbi:flagellar hook-associated protein FlgK [Bacillus sp. S13(2024)]|uniref:flagellar hook-associated protein FlgK n=1 Tax=unclassified Bacillus (in: firmicutes) TaxID=185979 RepID=UPI003D1D44D4